MSFWDLAVANLDAPALCTGHDLASLQVQSFRELALAADRFARLLGSSHRKRLGLLLCRNETPAIHAYLGALRRGDALMLLNESTDPRQLQGIIAAYRPDWIVTSSSDAVPCGYTAEDIEAGWQLCRRSPGQDAELLHPDLAILLSTSGSTGSPKMVRLSHANVAANAASIVEYLGISPGERTITTLPFNYSYGMSVINSHLQAGAATVLTEAGLLTREFWDTFKLHEVTSLAGVPYTYQMLHRLNPRKLPLQSLRTLTQAGGRLSAPLIENFRTLAEENGWRFFVMYGQTEASPRISYVPPEMLKEKCGSIGIAIPGGQLSVSPECELVYEGANVMMGYAMCRADLAQGDDMHGRLATGDLASTDIDGYFYLHGRLKRFVKIHGNRMSLDDIETRLEADLNVPVAVAGEDDKLRIFFGGDVDESQARTLMSTVFRLHASTYTLTWLESLPYTTSGKKDYGGLSK